MTPEQVMKCIFGFWVACFAVGCAFIVATAKVM